MNSLLSLLAEHWQIIIGVAIIAVGVLVCMRCNIDFSLYDRPRRR